MINVKEDLIKYIWKHQKYNNKNIFTDNGHKITVYWPGTSNNDQGPDFMNARIMIGGTVVYGSVEIHVNAKDWYNHGHHNDPRYNNVILHIIWNESIAKIKRLDNTVVPALSLKYRVPPRLLKTYKKLIYSDLEVPCTKYYPSVNYINKVSMLEKVLFQRLTNKNLLINKLLKNNNGDWEETVYQSVAHSFGCKINSLNFLELAKSLKYKFIKKHVGNLLEIEALLMGQANLLLDNNYTEKEDLDYIKNLKETYKYLSHKYNLKNSTISYDQWIFFRLRPANFPTIRIAQFAKLLNKKINLFNFLIHGTVKDLYDLFNVQQSDYWQNHFIFGKKSKKKIPKIGKASIENIIINSIVPLLVSYSKFIGERMYADKAIAILQAMPAEKNSLLNKWTKLGVKINNAFDSQAYIELYNNFCKNHKCLDCKIGCKILDKSEYYKDLLEEALTNSDILIQ